MERSPSQILKHLLICIVGFAITLPYFYNRQEFTDWMIYDIYGGNHEAAKDPVGFTNLMLCILFLISLRSLAVATSKPSDWVERGDGRLRHIEDMLQYRDSRLKGMTNEQGAALMRETQILDGLSGYAQGSETRRVAEYMNSRLAGMPYEKGLEYLKNPNIK